MAHKFLAEKVHVKCNQTGTIHKVKIYFLSKTDDSELCHEDMKAGNELIMDFDKKSYPVTTIKITSQSGMLFLFFVICQCGFITKDSRKKKDAVEEKSQAVADIIKNAKSAIS